MQDGKVVSEINGNYMGYLDFDGVRYWDVREIDKWYFKLKDWEADALPSDSSRRSDIVTLKTKNAALAQIEKDILES